MGKIRAYADNPNDLQNNVKALRGLDLKRLRVGDWRVLFDENGKVLTVTKIGPRGDIYD